MELVVVAKNLVKKYKDMMAVNNVDFTVASHESFGLIGPNGAGKTTTMKMIYCYLPRTSGQLQVLNYDPAIYPDKIKNDLGVVPQETNLDTDLNVMENLTSYARYFNISKEKAKSRAKELLGFVQLSEKRNSKIEELSSGMKRRLLIARGLINNPRLLILDEPTVGLDPQARHLIWERLFALKKQNVSFISTTHYMDEAEQLCDRVALMDNGKILISGQPRTLINQYIGEEVIEIQLSAEEKIPAKFELAAFDLTMEKTDQKLYLYCKDCRPLLNKLVEKGYQHILRRPATLEDVFFKFSGRNLIE